MKVKIIKQELLKTLQSANDVSERDNINSYYSYFIFIAKNGVFIIKSASRQTTFIETIIQNEQTKLEIQEEGAFLVPGSKIFDIIQSLQNGLIVLESLNQELIMVEDGPNKTDIEFRLRLRNIEDYPTEIHNIEKTKTCTINKFDMLKLINNTHFSASSNTKETTSSMFLTGILFDINENKLTAVATDRNRISISSVDIDGISVLKEEMSNDIIVPLKFIQLLKRILTKQEKQEIVLFINKEKIFFEIDSIILSSNLISGHYYDYKRIIPSKKRNQLIINTKELYDAVSRIIVVNENKKNNNVLFNVEDNEVKISVEEKEKSNAKITVQSQNIGNPAKFLIKSLFVLEPLSVVETDEVCIDYGDTTKDLIKITAIDDKETIHIAAQLNQ